MQPGGTCVRLIRIRDAADAAVTGLTLAALTVEAYAHGYGAANWTTYAASAALTEIGGGRYRLTHTLPAAAGWFDVFVLPNDATRTVFDDHWQGEVETQDLDSLYANVVKSVALPTQGALLGNVVPGELVAYRWNRWQIPITDIAGAPIDLSGYTNLTLSVRSKDQTTKKLDATNGGSWVITANASGIITIEWPESTGAGAADIYGWLVTGDLTKEPLYYELVGDQAGNAARTVPILRSSQLTITRREVGS